ILMIASIIWTGISAYNYYIYGNCNGASLEDQEKTCLFDPHGENSQISTAEGNATISNAPPTIDGVNLSLFPAYQGKSIKDEMVYVGCYACPNTKKVNPEINQLVGENRDTLKLVFIHLPLHKEYEYLLNIENCLYQENKAAYWTFHQKMMDLPKEEVKDKEKVLTLLTQIKEINASKILACSESKEAQELSEKQLQEIHKMNIKGTPTIFVNGEVFIGPKPMRVYEMQLSTYVNWFSISLFSLLGIIIAILLYYGIFKRG
ncbi:MAG: thioredoxin domain-containing protein, partial [Nanoarchaeota archaeon]